jgi:hypothetical protein
LRETQTIISRMELGEVKKGSWLSRELELLCLARLENNIRMIKFLAQRHVAKDPDRSAAVVAVKR